jgi:NAD(P)-dependent dehydrogenase (short-subunit alcohol dehydrogenase family)
MPESFSNSRTILITGGTSGLGLELVKLFLRKGYYVVATGRNPIVLSGFEERFKLYRVDFSDLKQTAETVKTICNNHSISFVVNNAGILSPPDFRITGDGNEYTFQVNYLAHLLINEIIIRKFGSNHPVRIAAITSIVYKLARADLSYCRQERDYKSVKAYSDSKFFIAMMCGYLAEIYRDIDFRCFSIDPGVFGSSIYRMQKGWFRFLYHIAAPFMRKPSKVAKVLAQILTDHGFSNGVIYDIRKRIKRMKEIDRDIVNNFWEESYSLIKSYLD